MTDFFVSYTSADKQWAEWIAYVLEEEHYSVILQAWDFRPGSNFILEMQEAAKKAARTIMVLSPNYLKSQFASPEWAAAFAKDPQGLMRKVIPVVVDECNPDGLLGQIVHINLASLDPDAAKDALISGVRKERAKPKTRPAFPGNAPKPLSAFPGSSPVSSPAQGAYMPKLNRSASDVEKRRFLKKSFDAISAYFQNALAELARHASNLEFDFQPITTTEFTAEIFLHGKSAAFCRIRQGSDVLSRNGISFSEGQHMSTNSVNEVLSVSDGAGEVCLTSLMGGFGYGGTKSQIDVNRMTPEQGAEYLWRRFVARLEA